MIDSALLFRGLSTALLFNVSKTRDDFDGTVATNRSAVDGGAARPISQISNNNGELALISLYCHYKYTKILIIMKITIIYNLLTLNSRVQHHPKSSRWVVRVRL